MNPDYTLTYTLSGETATDAFRFLRHAELALDGLRRNPLCSKATLRGLGYVIGEHVCSECGGTGIVPGHDTQYEPGEASETRCTCQGPVVVRELTAAELAEIRELVDAVAF